MTELSPEERAEWRRQVDLANEHDMGHVWLWRAGLLLDALDKTERQRDEAQEHVAYHLRDFVPGGDDKATGDLAVDMTRYADRMKARAAELEAGINALADDGSKLGTSGRLLIWPEELRALTEKDKS